ncbi:hypothetical protein [Roseiflexus sp.]|uniref:hypothetical protein n=1 Tax=Roseiflexus sp. TaxID=2562120 RepID=UPI00398B5E4F
MDVTAWFRRLVACEYGGGVVEYVGVSGLALLVTGWIIVTISSQRFVIGRAMADIHARQITSFESGLGGTANTDAQLYPRVTPPTLPVISIPRLFRSEQASSWWNELWKEREWTWYRDLMERWFNSGWAGLLTGGLFAILIDFLFGLSPDGKFSIGWVIISIIGTIAMFFGVGWLQKIPLLGRLLVKLPGIMKYPHVQRFLSMAAIIAKKSRMDALFRYLWSKGGANLFKDLIVDRKFGTWIDLILRHGRVPKWVPKWLAKSIKKESAINVIKQIGNFIWYVLRKPKYAIIEFFLKLLAKDVIKSQNHFFVLLRWIFTFDSFKDIGRWAQRLLSGQVDNSDRRRRPLVRPVVVWRDKNAQD